MRVDRLVPSDAPAYRRLMLEAYESAADAFTSTVDERSGEPMSFWIRRIADPAGLAAVFGAFEGTELVGAIALEYSSKPRTRHKAQVLGMYVTPAARRRQAARRLLAAAMENARAREGVCVLTLTATEGNCPAIDLYRSAGFEVFGVEPMAILTSGGYRAKVHMWVSLTGVPIAGSTTRPGGPRMTPRITVVTLGVDDLETSLRFYRDGLGLETEGIVGEEFEHGAVVFIPLRSGLRLALWPRASIGHDTGLAVGAGSATEMTLGHNVSSREEVDAVMAVARSAGGVIVKDAHATFWGGYSGYFQDPDGHLWEVVWNPQWAE